MSCYKNRPVFFILWTVKIVEARDTVKFFFTRGRQYFKETIARDSWPTFFSFYYDHLSILNWPMIKKLKMPSLFYTQWAEDIIDPGQPKTASIILYSSGAKFLQ